MDRNQEEAILQMVFGSSRPPHQIIVFAFCNLLGWTTQQIKDQLFTSTLSALLNQLEQQCSAKFNSPLQPFFEIMRERLGHTLDEELSGKTAREIYTDLLTHTAGMISLSEFTANLARRDYFNSWWRNIEKTDREDLHLVAKVRQGMEDAFAELNGRHNHRLTGYIRPRVDNDSEVEDFSQEIWLEVWQKLSIFDPVRGNFESFLINRAKYKIRELIDPHPLIRICELTAPDFEDGPDDQQTRLIDLLMAMPRSPTIDCIIEASLFSDLVNRAFRSASPPHQLIAFGFCKLMEWKPGEIVTSLSDIPLRTLAKKLEEDYINCGVSREKVGAYFKALHDQMDLRCYETIKDSHIGETLRDQIVGDTTLRHHYKDKPEADIAHWWEAVRRRVRNDFMTKEA